MADVCFYTSSVFTHGGEQRVTAVIANELAKRHTVTVYTQDDDGAAAQNPYHLDASVHIKKIVQPSFGLANRLCRRAVREVNERTGLLFDRDSCVGLLEYAYFQKRWQAMLLEELKSAHFDVIIAVSGGNTIQLGMIADRLPCRVIGWEHNTFEAYFKTRGYYFYHQDALFRESLRRMDACVVLNDNIRKKYKKAFGKECEVIYNPRSFASREKSPLDQKMFVTLGRITHQKGYDLLIDSFALFAKENEEWNLTIVGDGEQRAEIEEKITEYGLKDRIYITGYQTDVRRYLLDASCYLMPSRWEGFPMVLTEAFEMGLPAVCYDIIAVEPLIENGKQGLLAKAYDTKDYAGQMLRIAQMPKEERRQMASYAIQKAKTLAIEAIIEKWEQLIK